MWAIKYGPYNNITHSCMSPIYCTWTCNEINQNVRDNFQELDFELEEGRVGIFKILLKSTKKHETNLWMILLNWNIF